ncbi:MAG: GNAT family protein [Aggregatilineales bacterium]
MTTIDGSKIRLRDMHVDDLPFFAEWQEIGQAWQKLDGPYYPHNALTDERKEEMRARILGGDLPDPRTRLIIADHTTDQLIGMVSRYWISEETQWTAIGIVLYDPAQWGKGIGYEALGLWSQYLFNAMPQIVRLDLRTWSGNVGMMKLAEKLGYLEEARFRMARIVEGTYYDGLGYGVLREEWNLRYPQGFTAE